MSADNPADDKLMIFFSQKTGFDISCILSLLGDNLHEISKPIFLDT